MTDYRKQAENVASKGRYGDTALLHVNPVELDMLSSVVPLTRNPDTGQPEAFLPLLLGLGASWLASAGMLGGLSAAAAGAIGSGLGSFIETGDLGQGVMSGVMGYGLGSLGESLNIFGEAGKEAASSGAGEAVGAAAGDAGTAAAMGSMAPAGNQAMLKTAAQESAADMATQSVNNAGGGFGSGVMGWIKKNPTLAAVSGAGLASQFYDPYEFEGFGKGKSNYQPLRMTRNVYNPEPSPTGVEQTYFSPAIYEPIEAQQESFNPDNWLFGRRSRPVAFAEGGLASVNPQADTDVSEQDRRIVMEAMMAIMKQHPNPQDAIRRFIQRFGSEALKELVQMVHGQEPATDEGGIVSGLGGGMSDMIPAQINGGPEARLSDGEFVVPSDVVSGLGDGSTDAGANRLQEMINRVRMEKTGTPQQPPMIANKFMMPR